MIYFDNAATSMPKPKNVVCAITDAMKKCGNSGRGGHDFSLNAAKTVYLCRKKLADIFNTRPECVVFTASATEALNIAIKGTNRAGGVTLISSFEHNSVMRPVNTLRRNGETVLRQFAVDTNDDTVTLDNFSSVSRSATNIVVTHASNVCGRILPIKDLKKLAPADSVFVLDASQTAGHIAMDIVDLGVDIICIPAHKGLFGPMGIGAMIINPYSDVIIEPLIEGGSGTDSKSPEMPELLPERLEAGTLNVGGIAGFSAALDLYRPDDSETLLFEYLLNNINESVDIMLYGISPQSDLKKYVPVMLFNKKGYDCETLCSLLAEKGFALRAGFHCAPNAHRTLGTYDIGGVRISLSKNNTKREIDRFVNALSEI